VIDTETNINIKITKSREEVAVELISTLAAAGCLYLITHPEVVEGIEQWWNDLQDKITHAFSVWQAILSIRSLPEK